MVACIYALHLKLDLLAPDLLHLVADCAEICIAFMFRTAAISCALPHKGLCTKRAADL